MKYLKILLMMLCTGASLSCGASNNPDHFDGVVVVSLPEEKRILDLIESMKSDLDKQQLIDIIRRMYSSNSLGDMAITRHWFVISESAVMKDLICLSVCLAEAVHETVDRSKLLSVIKKNSTESEYKMSEVFYDNLPTYALEKQWLICNMFAQPKSSLNSALWKHAELIAEYVEEVQKLEKERAAVLEEWEIL